MRNEEFGIDSNWKFSCVQFRNFDTRKVCQVVQELKSSFSWLELPHHMNHKLEAKQSRNDTLKLGIDLGRGVLDPGLGGHRPLSRKFRLGLTQRRCCIPLQLASWLDKPSRCVDPKSNDQHLPSKVNATAFLSYSTFLTASSLSRPLVFCTFQL